MQGLSDWVTAKLPQPGDLLAGGCNLYFWIEDPLVPGTSAEIWGEMEAHGARGVLCGVCA